MRDDAKVADRSYAPGGFAQRAERARSRSAGKSGATPAEIGKQVLLEFTASVARTVAASQAQRLIEKEQEGQAGEAAGGLSKRFMK